MFSTDTVFFDSDYCRIGVNNDLKAATLRYKRKGDSSEFRGAHLKLIELFESNPQPRILVDAQHLGLVDPEDQKWVGRDVIPTLAKHTPDNFIKLAVVTAPYIFTKLAVDTVERVSMETGICLNRNFESINEAKMWLQEQ